MPHLILLGDSVLDNASYTQGSLAVIDHLKQQLPAGWNASLGAIDGSTTEDVHSQIDAIPADATHLLLSVGGNNAILRAEILDMPVTSSADALRLLASVAREFEASYRKTIAACRQRGLPLVVCTVYHGNFPDLDYQLRIAMALAVFNDVIVRVALDHQLKVIDLRSVCNAPSDYANPIEPSATGGAKIARAIVQAVTEPAGIERGARLVA